MKRASKKQYGKRKRLIWFLSIFIMVGGVGLFAASIAQKMFFQKQIKREVSRERWLYWCPTPLFEPREINPCFYVSRDGAVLGEAPRLSGTLFPKFYGTREMLMAALPFVEHFYALGKFVMTDKNTLEIGWPDAMRIKVLLKDDPEKIAANLALIEEKGIDERRDEVEYIDLRFGNRVYYKIRAPGKNL